MMNFWRWYRKNDRIFTAILNIVMVVVLFFSIYLFYINKQDPYGNKILEAVGYQPVFVQTGSMEPTMRTHSIVLIKRVDSMDELEIDDIVTFQVFDGSGKPITITHRIYNIKEDGSIITKGDNNRVADNYTLTIDNIKAEVVGIWNGAATIIDMMMTPMGIVIGVVGLLIIILFFYATGQFTNYLDEKYGINEDVADSVNDQLKADNEYVQNKNEIIEETASMNVVDLSLDQQIPQLLDAEKNSWQRIYNYDVSEDNLITITGVKKNFVSLTEISVPKEIKHKKVVGIGAFAFKDSKATIIHLPDTLESIGKAAFYHCSELLYVNIPNTIKEIGPNAFEGCKMLMDIKLPVNLTKISDKTFADCASIETVTINDKVTMIGDNAFAGCHKLTTIYGARGVKLIKLNAFKTRMLIDTNIITDNECLKKYNWEASGRTAIFIDDPDMLEMVDSDNKELELEYEAFQEKLRIEQEQMLSTKVKNTTTKWYEILLEKWEECKAEREEKQNEKAAKRAKAGKKFEIIEDQTEEEKEELTAELQTEEPDLGMAAIVPFMEKEVENIPESDTENE